MGQLYLLASEEEASFNQDALQQMRQSLGTTRCQEILEEAVFGLTDDLGALEAAVAKEQYDQIADLSLKIYDAAKLLGMLPLVEVAGNLRECAFAEDRVSVFAVSGRLVRISEELLFQIIQFADQPS
jgi:hypothetical protein